MFNLIAYVSRHLSRWHWPLVRRKTLLRAIECAERIERRLIQELAQERAEVYNKHIEPVLKRLMEVGVEAPAGRHLTHELMMRISFDPHMLHSVFGFGQADADYWAEHIGRKVAWDVAEKIMSFDFGTVYERHESPRPPVSHYWQEPS